MFNLNTGVHFHEVEITMLVKQKLYGSGTLIVNGRRCCYSRITHSGTKLFVDRRRRSFLDELLMAALYGAVTFTEVHRVTVLVCKYLYLNVARVFNELFNIDAAVAERLLRFILGSCKCLCQFSCFSDNPHPLAASSGCWFDDDGVAYFFCSLFRFLDIGYQSLASRYNRYVCGHHGFPGSVLITHFADHFGLWADKFDAGRTAHLGEVGVFS